MILLNAPVSLIVQDEPNALLLRSRTREVRLLEVALDRRMRTRSRCAATLLTRKSSSPMRAHVRT